MGSFFIREAALDVLVDTVAVQDRDLLSRLNAYFATLDARLREAQGWLIFNAPPGSGRRGSRLVRFMLERLAAQSPFVSYYHVPWRDFALNAYMMRVELASHFNLAAGGPSGSVQVNQQYHLAEKVSSSQHFQMRFCDLLLIADTRPKLAHEVVHLADIIGDRYRARRATILVLPGSPAEADATFAAIDPSQASTALWQQIYAQMYQTSLLAL